MVRQRNLRIIENETPEQRCRRLDIVLAASQNRRQALNRDSFNTSINIFADVPCSVCKKALFPKQRCTITSTP